MKQFYQEGGNKNSTTTDDETPGTVWILGVIDVNDKSKFLLKRVANRQVDTIVQILRPFVEPFGNFITDGYSSYPRVTEKVLLDHKIVIHNDGFVNNFRDHTNDIEAFCLDFKGTMRREKGVKRSNIDN
ncbi:hypothetical protein DMUE_3660 [Dictyocoela muelleri]|nr:hypothetical protein DMUE_3660 [Dictyocoela muelleri]